MTTPCDSRARIRTRTLFALATVAFLCSVVFALTQPEPQHNAPPKQNVSTSALDTTDQGIDPSSAQIDGRRMEAAASGTKPSTDQPLTHDEGVYPPDAAKDAATYLRAFKIPSPATLLSQDDWVRFQSTVESMRAQIAAAGRERNALIDRVAEGRRAKGMIERHRYDGQPSQSDPDWQRKWPWMEKVPGEWRQTRTLADGDNSFMEIVRIMPGEDADIEAAEQKRQGLIQVLRADIEHMIVTAKRPK